jgi:uncharacterized membrane protein
VIPFFVMLAGIAVSRLAGAAGADMFESWPGAVRGGLALMFVFTGVAHFTSERADLIRMVPPALPNPGALVTISGVAEIAGGIGLLIPPVRTWAAIGLIVLLAAVFPANVHAAQSGHTIRGRPHTPMFIRAPLQVLWICLLWWVG